MAWFFLNLLFLGAALWIFFSLSFRFDYTFITGLTNKLDSVSRLIEDESNGRSREERDEVLARYSSSYGVEFFLFDNVGRQLGGRNIDLPPTVASEITMPDGRPGDFPPPPPPRGTRPPRPAPQNSIYVKTDDPQRYWSGTRIMLSDPETNRPIRARVLAVSDSMFGKGLFFDPTPWLIIAGIVVGGSILFWLPFVSGITRAVGQMTAATERIANEDFDVRIEQNRGDELGRLGGAINHLSTRLSGFVNGQKRFLGDISHELNSPLARMNFALGILEERAGPNSAVYIEDVKEEVGNMSKLVAELMTYAKAGINAPNVELEPVHLLPLVERVVKHETAIDEAEVSVRIDEELTAVANFDLLSRAVANVLRNAIRYAGDAGPIEIEAEKANSEVAVTISDRGTGVPDAALDKLFDPFFRIESDRARETGGTGLGMAIVKSCVEACGGRVTARNGVGSGLKVTIYLKTETIS